VFAARCRIQLLLILSFVCCVLCLCKVLWVLDPQNLVQIQFCGSRTHKTLYRYSFVGPGPTKLVQIQFCRSRTHKTLYRYSFVGPGLIKPCTDTVLWVQDPQNLLQIQFCGSRTHKTLHRYSFVGPGPTKPCTDTFL